MRKIILLLFVFSFAVIPHILYADNASTGSALNTAGDAVSNVPVYGTIAGTVLKGIGSFLENSVMTISNWIKTQSPAMTVAKLFLYVLEFMSNALTSLNNLLFGKVFGLLMVYMDYTRIPQIQSEFSNLYGLISKIAYTLIALFVFVSLFLLATSALFQDTGAKMASAGGLLAMSVVVSVALISATPTIFSKTTGLMKEICFELMFHSVQGENVDYSTAVNLSNSASSDFLSNAVNDSISKLKLAAGNVVDTMKMSYVQPIEDKVNSYISDPGDKLNTYIKNEIPALSSLSADTDSQVNQDFTNQARVYVLKIFVAIGSISMLLALLCLKGVQLLSLFVMLLMAPLVTMFLILPKGHRIVVNFWKEILGLLSAPIVWALMIKIYFLIKLALGDSTSGSILSASDFSFSSDQSVLLLFMELAIIVSMLSVTAIIAKVLIASTMANAHAMAGMLSGVPSAVGGLVGGVVGAGTGAAAFTALWEKHGSIGKAVMGMSRHSGKFFGAANPGGAGNSNSNKNNINEMVKAFSNQMQAGSSQSQSRTANAGPQSRSVSTMEYNGQNVPQYGGYWDNYMQKKQQSKQAGASSSPVQNIGEAKQTATVSRPQASSVNQSSIEKPASGGKTNAS